MTLRGIALVSALSIFGAVATAEAAVTTFTDRTAFEAATTVTETQDFESAPGFPGAGSVASVDSYAIGSLTFDGDPGGRTNDIALFGTGFLAGGTQALGANFLADSTIMFIDAGFTSVGFDLFSEFNDSDITISVFDSLDNMIAMTTLTVGGIGDGVFFGVSAMTDIRRIVLDSLAGQGEIIDNILLGDASVIPLPGAVPLFLAGLAGLGATRRRKNA